MSIIKNTVKKIFLYLIKFYQFFISPWLGSRCRFSPTCSEYAKDALKKLPLYKAVPFIIWRLLRCNPFCEGGFDPVIKD